MKQTAVPQTATTAVAVTPQGGTALANIIPIKGMEDISRLGVAVAKSGWFGSIGQSTGEMIAMTMLQERISPVTFKKKYHVMSDGSLSVASRAIVSAFKRLGGKMKLHEVSKDKCDITFSYDGNELRYAVTLQEFIDNGVAVSAKTGSSRSRASAGRPAQAYFCPANQRPVNAAPSEASKTSPRGVCSRAIDSMAIPPACVFSPRLYQSRAALARPAG